MLKFISRDFSILFSNKKMQGPDNLGVLAC